MAPLVPSWPPPPGRSCPGCRSGAWWPSAAPERLQHRFRYPVLRWPAKVGSFNLDKNPVAGGILDGIKGQYLIFDGGVINLRKYAGYQVEVLSG